MNEAYIAQDAALEYFRFCLKGNNIPDVETDIKRT